MSPRHAPKHGPGRCAGPVHTAGLRRQVTAHSAAVSQTTPGRRPVTSRARDILLDESLILVRRGTRYRHACHAGVTKSDFVHILGSDRSAGPENRGGPLFIPAYPCDSTTARQVLPVAVSRRPASGFRRRT